MIQCRREHDAADDVVWRSAVDARPDPAQGASPVALTESGPRAHRRLIPLNAFCLVAHDVARRAAREAEIAVMKGEPLGLLHGVPVSVKDVLFTRGLRTTGGSRLYADLVPEADAVSVGASRPRARCSSARRRRRSSATRRSPRARSSA